MDQLEGIAQADARLGQRFPLPAAPLPLARWVEVRCLADGCQVEWNLDDTRGGPGRLTLYAGRLPPPDQGVQPTGELRPGIAYATATLDHAQASLRPVHELSWQADGLHLRLTAQGPWEVQGLLDLVVSIA